MGKEKILNPAKAQRRREKMKDNEKGEIEGNSGLKRNSSGQGHYWR